MEIPEHLEVKVLAHVVPVSAQDLLDAGLPLPPGMEPPPAPRPLSRRQRWRMARADFTWAMRRRIGFWIAGVEPDDGGW
ncbi:hypothetical protein ACH41H_36445 [Streptomyces sp. NPDC020800]|uniref:hypothetical protein n=1 Tax=Streptomyces sp. NPDC020800 TaxID=3365092 RepID=UPI003791CDAD